jgi:hypothetical protein
MTVCKTVRDIHLTYARSRIRALTYINAASTEIAATQIPAEALQARATAELHGKLREGRERRRMWGSVMLRAAT